MATTEKIHFFGGSHFKASAIARIKCEGGFYLNDKMEVFLVDGHAVKKFSIAESNARAVFNMLEDFGFPRDRIGALKSLADQVDKSRGAKLASMDMPAETVEKVSGSKRAPKR